MTFNLFHQLGLAGLDLSLLFIGLGIMILILFVLVIIQMVQINKLKKKYNKFMGGKDVKSLEKQIEKIVEDNKYIIELFDDNRRNVKDINIRMDSSYNKVGIVKYDAFKQMGGMLSFSIALLNEVNSGFIINSVHSSEGCYVYVKEIEAGICDIELSNEEKEALIKAMKK